MVIDLKFHGEIQSIRQKLDEKADSINKIIDSSKKEIIEDKGRICFWLELIIFLLYYLVK